MINKLFIIPALSLVLLLTFPTVVFLTEDTRPVDDEEDYVATIKPNIDTPAYEPSWKKIDSFSGYGDYFITYTPKENRKYKFVASAMPLMNYEDNQMLISVENNGNVIKTSELFWEETSKVASKTTSAEFTPSGTFNINIYAYELEYWNIEIYEWY
ncbi:MAG: hypothetical protein FWC41_09335 [Firmicutes bacterium]|nr:hypothetical protein [Bacillota bacterium]